MLFQIENLDLLNTKYKYLFNYDQDLFSLVNKKLLFNLLPYNKLCGKNVNDYDFNQYLNFVDIIFNSNKYENLKNNILGFNFQYLIINNLYVNINKNLDKNTNKQLIITNFSSILYNYTSYLKEYRKHNPEFAKSIDTILFPNLDYTDEINKKRLAKYKQLENLDNIYSSHSKKDYLAFLKNVLQSNDLHNIIPHNDTKYNFISCHYGHMYGLNQTASIRTILDLPQYISTIGLSLKYLQKGGSLVIFTTIANVNIQSYRQIIGLLCHTFQKCEVISNDINQNILIGVPEFYIKCTGFKDNLSDSIINSLIQIGIDSIDYVHNICNVIDYLDITTKAKQSVFYKHSISNHSTKSFKSSKKTRKELISSISKFLKSNHPSKSSISTRTSKTKKQNKIKSSLANLNYISKIAIPELDAILEDEQVAFRVMILCNKIETLFVEFFEMVNYHIENSIEIDRRGKMHVTDITIQQKTYTNLSRLLAFLEHNKLPYNRYALALLQNKQSELINAFYNLYGTIETHLIHYNDNQTKRIEKHALDHLRLLDKQDYPEIATAFKRIDLAYRSQENLLEQLKLKDIPASVRYATEDMARGLAKYISRRFADSLPPVEMVSNAFIKLWECLTVFNIIPINGSSNTIINTNTNTNTKGTYKVFHICEAPGQMILSAQHFISKKRPHITHYEWLANSLNPFSVDVKKQYGRVLQDTYGLIRKNPGKWLWGADNTGDITKVGNIKWFRNRILGQSRSSTEMSGVDLIIGDGGLGSGNDALVLQRLDLAQVVMVLACSRVGGACIIKHFTPYMTNHPESIDASSFFISYLYLYYLAFDEVSLFKPYSSDMTSGEFYVIGKGFKLDTEKDDGLLERLYRALDKFEVNNALFPRDAIPASFVLQVQGFIEQMADYNVTGYEKSNMVLTCYKEQNQREAGKGKAKENEKLEKVLHCKDFLDEDRIEEILVPRYNKWVRLYEFV